jgi:hypothetical protein
MTASAQRPGKAFAQGSQWTLEQLGLDPKTLELFQRFGTLQATVWDLQWY